MLTKSGSSSPITFSDVSLPVNGLLWTKRKSWALNDQTDRGGTTAEVTVYLIHQQRITGLCYDKNGQEIMPIKKYPTLKAAKAELEQMSQKLGLSTI